MTRTLVPALAQFLLLLQLPRESSSKFNHGTEEFMGTEGPQSEPRQPRKAENHVCRPVGYGAAGRRSASGRAHGSGPHSGQQPPSGPRKSLMWVASKCHGAHVGGAEDEGCWRRVCAGSPASVSNVCGAFLG